MKPRNKIQVFFIACSLIFWNPLSFYFIYGSTPVYSFKLIHFLFYFTFIIGAGIIYGLLSNKITGKLSNILFSVSMLGILFSIVVLINGLLGSLAIVKEKNKAKDAGLIFAANTSARWHTTEFDCVAEINSIGLRDKEIEISKGNKFRILCFGDSWTFGWGVNLENSWPKKLESFLKSKGIENVEVINCGQPGRYTTTYKKNIEKVVPVLKPDLVLLGVLQLDDLAQLYENSFPLPGEKKDDEAGFFQKIIFAVKNFLKYSANNIITLCKTGRSPAVDITKTWKSTVRKFINKLTPEEMARYTTVNDSVRHLLQSGNLNPAFLYYFFNYPDRITTYNNPDHPATRFAISEMNKDVASIRTICAENNAGLIFINLPGNIFTGQQVIAGPAAIPNSWYEHHNKIDSMYRLVAANNFLPYIELTDSFRAQPNKSAYFFRYDGHPNQNGYEKIAELVGQNLIDSNRIVNRK